MRDRVEPYREGPRRCLRVDGDATREDIIAAGVTPEAADELLAMRDRLLGKAPGPRDHMAAVVPPEAWEGDAGTPPRQAGGETA